MRWIAETQLMKKLAAAVLVKRPFAGDRMKKHANCSGRPPLGQISEIPAAKRQELDACG